MASQNIENNTQKDTYDKFIAGKSDLFSDSGFDEMQKIKNHEIGFKLFRIFFYIMYAVSIAIIGTAVALENTVFTIIGYGLIVLCTFFYLLYSAKASAAGVMNQRFAENASKKSNLFCGIAVLALWLFMIAENKSGIVGAGMWIIMAVIYIGNYLCSSRNMKILEKMLKDENEED